MDNYTQMVQSLYPVVLRYCSRAVLHGIHSVFLPTAVTGHGGEDSISPKKLMEGEGLWKL